MTQAQDPTPITAAPHVSFPALRHPGFRVYFFASALAMMADSIEHVISYWVIFQKFHSQTLGGFAVVSHWLPFLFFSVYAGALADRFDPRRIIQLGMVCFIVASVGWGYFFVTDTLEMWHAMVLLVWLWKAPYGPRFSGARAPGARAVRGFGEIWSTMRAIAGHRTIVSMTLLAGGASLFVGNAYQAQMPEFAEHLGHGDAGVAYSMLLAADAAGALIAGIVLEGRGLLQPRPRTAFILAMLWCCAIGGFAIAPSYPIAFALLFVAGFFQLAFAAMSQALVQINAPAEIRGRVIGLYSMSSLGLRAFSGVTVGILGSLIGVHWSLALSAMVLLAITAGLLAFTTRVA